MIEDILEFNKHFVENKGYEPFVTDKYPKKKVAILTCMDTRLTVLLQEALGLKNGDAKIIKNAGGLILDPYDSAVRSLLVAIYELGVTDIMVIHHSSCGACHMSMEEMKPVMLEKGITQETINAVNKSGVNLNEWLEGFHDTEASVRKTVNTIVNHPLIPSSVSVHGFIIDSTTGELTKVE